VDTCVFDLADGRELGFSEAGDPAGYPAIAFHGTPGSRRQFLLPMADEAARKVGIRLIAPDRPGYGHSTFQPGRRFRDWPADVSELADRLGIDRFAAIGVSGGGPHALACGALLADRVSRVAVVSGIGPMAGPEDTEGMMRANQVLASIARRSERAVVAPVSLMVEMARRHPEKAIDSMAKPLPPSDAAVLGREEIRRAFVADARLASGTTARAAAQDLALFARPWGFELSSIGMHVDFWQGDADRNVPPAHARRQAAQVKDSSLHEIAGEGHFMVVDHLEEILQALTR
jgi:pimeloyl-ACP methyl ester carboxylesterase